jgi:ribonucleoside-diphosphate reductase alpha chain
MVTSVIDYVFRELAISYLGREELAQVHSEDLRNTTMGQKALDEEFTEEEVVSETVYEGERPTPVHENEHLHPHSRGITRGHDAQGNVLATPLTVSTAPPTQALANAALLRAEPNAASLASRQTRIKIAEAKLKGYEGDPCGGCGAFTLVRNGTCLKCISCGATSGCS